MNQMEELLWIDENNGGLMDRDDEDGVWKDRTVRRTGNWRCKNEKAIELLTNEEDKEEGREDITVVRYIKYWSLQWKGEKNV